MAQEEDADAKLIEANLQVYFLDKSLRARAAIIIDGAIASQVDDPDVILRIVQGELLDDRQPHGVQSRLRDQIDRALKAHETAQQHYLVAGPSAQILDSLVEIAAAGIVGNASYDLLKASMRLALQRRKPATRQKAPPPKDLLSAYAVLAVIEQCRRHDLPVPRAADLRVTKWSHDVDSSTAYVRGGGRRHASLFASVDIPHADLGSKGANVTIRHSALHPAPH